jgi:hypothetical protein
MKEMMRMTAMEKNGRSYNENFSQGYHIGLIEGSVERIIKLLHKNNKYKPSKNLKRKLYNLSDDHLMDIYLFIILSKSKEVDKLTCPKDLIINENGEIDIKYVLVENSYCADNLIYL